MIVVGATAGALAAGGIAYAFTDLGNVVQTDGTIHACYEADGTMHVNENKGDASYLDCPSGQKRMTWNQRGLRGPTGPMGPPGPAYAIRTAITDDNTYKPARTTMQVWSYPNVVWLYMPSVDVRYCSVSATPVASSGAAVVNRYDYSYDHWIALHTTRNGADAEVPLDVTVACN
jgi:hypothetical protein